MAFGCDLQKFSDVSSSFFPLFFSFVPKNLAAFIGNASGPAGPHMEQQLKNGCGSFFMNVFKA